MTISLLNRLFLSCCVVLPIGGTTWTLLQQMQMIYIKCPFKENYYNSVDMLLNTFTIEFSCSSEGMLQRRMLQFQQRLKTNGILLMSLSCWRCTISNAASPLLHLTVLLLLACPSEKNRDSLMYWISYLISSINVTCWYLMGRGLPTKLNWWQSVQPDGHEVLALSFSLSFLLGVCKISKIWSCYWSSSELIRLHFRAPAVAFRFW